MREIDKGPDIGHIVSAAEQIRESPETTDDMISKGWRWNPHHDDNDTEMSRAEIKPAKPSEKHGNGQMRHF